MVVQAIEITTHAIEIPTREIAIPDHVTGSYVKFGGSCDKKNVTRQK